MVKRRKPKYTGLLAKPINIPSAARFVLVEGLKGSDLESLRQQYVMREMLGRMDALYAHYDLEPGQDNAFWLAFKLACDWVPGFQVGGRPRGRPIGRTKGGAPAPLRLFFDAEKMRRAQPSLTITKALEQLKTTMRYRGRGITSLRAHYREGALLGRPLLAVCESIPGSDGEALLSILFNDAGNEN